MIFDGPNEEDVELMDEDTRTFGGCKIVETCSLMDATFPTTERTIRWYISEIIYRAHVCILRNQLGAAMKLYKRGIECMIRSDECLLEFTRPIMSYLYVKCSMLEGSTADNSDTASEAIHFAKNAVKAWPSYCSTGRFA